MRQHRKVGGKTYGPYWVRVWREGGKVRKSYVMPHELERVRDACAANRENRRRLARSRAEIKRTLSNFAFLGRILVRMERRGGDATVVTEAELERLERTVGTA